jgi:redox-regulated HSP33 family molecular chaperone
MASSTHGDRAKRALTDDNAFRVITVDATETVRGVITAQKVSGEAARVFAELVVGAVLVRETMSPDLRVQAILQSGDAAKPWSSDRAHASQRRASSRRRGSAAARRNFGRAHELHARE